MEDNSDPKELLEKSRVRGEGGAPTRASSLPTDASSRKEYPIATGVLDYFPDALVAIAEISKAGNDQHNPGLPLRWTRSKSGDESDTCMRHFLQRGTIDIDGKRHTAKAAWRILALLQKEIEEEQDKALTKQENPIIINNVHVNTLMQNMINDYGIKVEMAENKKITGWQYCNCEECQADRIRNASVKD